MEEIDRNRKWLCDARYTAYNIDVAFASIYRKVKDLEQEPCEDCVSREAVNELFDSEIKMYKERIETRKGSNYHDETERIKEFRSRIANAEYWQDKIKDLPPVTPTRKKGNIKLFGYDNAYDVILCLDVDSIKEGDILWLDSENGLKYRVEIININNWREPSMKYAVDLMDCNGVRYTDAYGDYYFCGQDFIDKCRKEL